MGERNIIANFDNGTARDHRIFGKGADAAMMVHNPIITGDPAGTRQQPSLPIGKIARFTQGGTPVNAHGAMAASGHKGHHHMITAFQIGDMGSAFFDNRRGFMAQSQRGGARPVTIDHRQIGMAQTRRRNPDQHFIGPGRCQSNGFNMERLGLRVRIGQTRLFQNCCPHTHARLLRSLVPLAAGHFHLMPFFGNNIPQDARYDKS